MKTLFSTLLIAAAIAGPAAAQEVRVSIVGKSPEVVRAEISRAAATVCLSAYRDRDVAFTELNACERDLTDDGLRQAGVAAKSS